MAGSDGRARIVAGEAVSVPADRRKIEDVIADEEAFIRFLRSGVFRLTLAAALRRAGVRDEAQMVANALSSREDGVPLPMTMADGVIAYIAAAIEAGTGVRRSALEVRNAAEASSDEALS